ncbi:MAG: SsrA-binding protein SmpB [Solirubrobacteraceae bacterium]|nr:SsrA-binding protein SmpB [Solirubrobacteraceae bacterium]
MAKSPTRAGNRPGDRDITRNRNAAFRYELLDTFECGVALVGTEVKSLRDGGSHLRDSYAILRGGELWLVGAHIPPYGAAHRFNHPPDRDRKLLLHRREIDKIAGQTTTKGLTVVPTRMYFKESNVKVEIALARGKDRFDKRQTIKNRDLDRDAAREVRDARR